MSKTQHKTCLKTSMKVIYYCLSIAGLWWLSNLTSYIFVDTFHWKPNKCATILITCPHILFCYTDQSGPQVVHIYFRGREYLYWQTNSFSQSMWLHRCALFSGHTGYRRTVKSRETTLLFNSCYLVYYCNNFSYDCIYSTNVSVTNCCVRRHHYFLASGRPRLCLTPLNTTQSLIGQVTSTSTTEPLIGPFTSSTTTQPLIGPVTSSTTTQPLSF